MRILSMSGYVPEQICDTVRFTGYTGRRKYPKCCGYASDFLAQVKHDPSIDGAVFTRGCASGLVLPQYLAHGKKFMYQMTVPLRSDMWSPGYFGAELSRYKECVEKHYHISIRNIPERVDYVNKRNAELKRIYDNLQDVNYGEYLQMIHDMLQKPLFEQKVDPHCGYSGGEKDGKKVYVVGSYLCNQKLANMIEECGMNVVGDNLPESGRLVSQPEVVCMGDLYVSIAGCVLWSRMSPTQKNFPEILEKDAKEIKKKRAKGVIFISQKGCQAYDMLYFVYLNRMRALGIPVTHIELKDSLDDVDVRAQLQTFSDQLRSYNRRNKNNGA